jgi:hypothetical protein
MLQRFIRCTGYAAVVVSLFSLANLILTVFNILRDWFTVQSSARLNEVIFWVIGLGVGSFMSFLTIVLDIYLEDKKWCKENKGSYSENMAQNQD